MTREVGALLAGYAVAGLFWGGLAAALPALQVRSGLGDGAFGLALGLMALSALPVMRVFGGALYRIERVAIPLAMLAFAAGCTVVALAPGRAGVILGLVVTGAASGALDIALNARTARVEAATGLSLFNRTHALFPAAMLGASLAMGALRSAGLPAPPLFLGVALAFLAVAALEYRVAAPPPLDSDETARGSRARLTGGLLLLALIAAAGAFQEAASNGWAAIYVERVRDGGPFWAGLAPAAFTLGLSAGRLAAHAAETRTPAMAAVTLAALVAIAAFGTISLELPLALAVGAFFIAGMGVGPIEPAVFRAAATQYAGLARGRALASVTAVAYLGYLLSPPALGLVAETAGWPALWLAAAGVAVVAALMARQVKPPH